VNSDVHSAADIADRVWLTYILLKIALKSAICAGKRYQRPKADSMLWVLKSE